LTIPISSISLGFHSQIEPYRQALHTDTAGTFARFGITDAAYAAFVVNNVAAGSSTIEKTLAPAKGMLDLALAIENASGEVRQTKGKSAVAIAPLPDLIAKFLAMAATWMVAEVALGITAPDQPMTDGPGDYIRRLYLLLYSSEFRKAPDPGKFDPDAWKALLQAVVARGGSYDRLLEPCFKLCGQVADEFTQSLWPDIW
jgi:hypothetical protein